MKTALNVINALPVKIGPKLIKRPFISLYRRNLRKNLYILADFGNSITVAHRFFYFDGYLADILK